MMYSFRSEFNHFASENAKFDLTGDHRHKDVAQNRLCGRESGEKVDMTILENLTTSFANLTKRMGAEKVDTMAPKDIDWDNLGFGIFPTQALVKYTWKDGAWDSGAVLESMQLDLNVYCAALHYGQSCFEGLKAFTGQDGKVRIFRPELNARRMQKSCEAVMMPAPPVEMFLEAVERCVRENRAFVPPPSSNGALYIRPFVFGSGPMLGLSPAAEYSFIVVCNPGGFGNPCKALICHSFDRAAPNGMGQAKVAGNYAPTLGPTKNAKDRGYTVTLFLDPLHNKYVEEFSTSNFAALTAPDAEGKRTYVTPKSKSILLSITNRSLSELAGLHFGWNVERRQVEYQELKDNKFEEIAACGTAVVISPVGAIHREINVDGPRVVTPSTDVNTLWDDEEDTPTIELEELEWKSDFSGFKQLYDVYRGIQTGKVEDTYGWMYPKEGI